MGPPREGAAGAVSGGIAAAVGEGHVKGAGGVLSLCMAVVV